MNFIRPHNPSGRLAPAPPGPLAQNRRGMVFDVYRLITYKNSVSFVDDSSARKGGLI